MSNNNNSNNIMNNSFMDQALNLNLMQSLLNTDKSNNGCFWSTLGKYLLLISQEQFKQVFKVLTDKFVDEIKTSKVQFASLLSIYQYAYDMLKFLFKPLTWLLRLVRYGQQQKQINLDDMFLFDDVCEDKSTFRYYINIQCTLKQCFWEALLKPINSKYVTYQHQVLSTTQEDKITFKSLEKLSNIMIRTDDFQAEFLHPIDSTFINGDSIKTLDHVNIDCSVVCTTYENDRYFQLCDQFIKNSIQSQPQTKDFIPQYLYVLSIPSLYFEGVTNGKNIHLALMNFKSNIVQSFTSITNSSSYFFVDYYKPDNQWLYFLPSLDSNCQHIPFQCNLNRFPSKEFKNLTSLQQLVKTMYNVDLKKDNNDLLFKHYFLVKFDGNFHGYFLRVFIIMMIMYDECRKLFDDAYKHNQYDKFCRTNDKKWKDMYDRWYFVNLFHIPVLHQHFIDFKAYIFDLMKTFPVDHVNLVYAKEHIEKVFSSPAIGGIDVLKEFINNLFASCSFTTLPFDLNKSSKLGSDTATQHVKLISRSDSIRSSSELHNTFLQFCQNLGSTVQSKDDDVSEGSSISVYTIGIHREQIVSKVPNPEFAVWYSNYERIKGLESKDEKSLNALVHVSVNAPPEFIDQSSINKTVKCVNINKVYKDMSTMYLSKKDKTTLTSFLSTFKNNKVKFQKLGLPNKLGVLLYGLPGCGKTSTVITIASYLQKDIYYMNLNGVKTNEELSMLFDYVVKQTSTSGIIVMEDIDAMTNIVHCRTSNDIVPASPLTTAELIESNENPLSLEYFLNLLQGTLTRENCVFIATTNHLERIDPAFYRPGRFDVKIEMKPADHYQIQQIFQTFFERFIDQDKLQMIPEYTFTPAQFIFKFAEHIVDPNASDEDILSEFFLQ